MTFCIPFQFTNKDVLEMLSNFPDLIKTNVQPMDQ